MKLYATITSERDSRPAKKGGDERIDIEISLKNNIIAKITARETGELYITPLNGGKLIQD